MSGEVDEARQRLNRAVVVLECTAFAADRKAVGVEAHKAVAEFEEAVRADERERVSEWMLRNRPSGAEQSPAMAPIWKAIEEACEEIHSNAYGLPEAKQTELEIGRGQS